MRPVVLSLLLLLSSACGDDGGTGNPTADAPTVNTDAPGGQIDAAIDGPSGTTFTLTSTTITEGTAIPTVHTCDGANTSPQLAWTGAPANTMGFAIIFTDKSNGLIHSIIYDIPAATAGLPASVEKVYAPTNVPGAHQTASYSAAVRGFNGPCPLPADGPHMYEHALYALGVATLAGTSMTTTRAQAAPLIMQNMLGVAKLTGTYDR